MKHTLIALMHDRPGVLNRAVSLFRRRGFNIDSLTVASTELPGLSRMTVVVNRDEVVQVVRQLERLIDIISVRDVTHVRSVSHEVCLVRLVPPGERLGELLAILRAFDARVVETDPQAMLLAVMGAPDDVSQCLELLRAFGVLELTRSGRIAMTLTQNSHSDGAAPRPDAGPQHPYTWQADGVVA